MPHKHTRRGEDPSAYDLPPSQLARPLPVGPPRHVAAAAGRSSSKTKKGKPETVANEGSSSKKNLKRKRQEGDDGLGKDAPRAFRRLMALAAGKKVRTGLDDGRPPPKKAKTGKQSKTGGTDTTDTAAKNAGRKSASEKPPLPTIHPSESLSDFSRRVDAALPLSAAAVSGKGSAVKDPLGLAKPFRTRKEKKMHRLYEQWRAEEKRIQERREEEAEAAEEREWELQEQLGELKGMGMEALGFGTGKGAKRKRKGGGKRHDDDDDPWAELKRKRGESDRVPFNEVAKAPPDLFGRKGKGGKVTVDGVPRAAGSLRSREMLQEARTEVLERYRQMMKSGH